MYSQFKMYGQKNINLPKPFCPEKEPGYTW